MKLKITVGGITLINIGADRELEKIAIGRRSLLACARYHKNFAKTVVKPVCGRTDSEEIKVWSIREATKHLEWAEACRSAAGNTQDEGQSEKGVSHAK